MSLRHTPMSLTTDSFGKIEFNDFIEKLDSAVAKTINEFFLLLKNIESHFSRNIFPVLSRVSDFDYYGEDFLENFFPRHSEIVKGIEEFLFAMDNSQ